MSKKIKPQQVVFTPESTGVSKILDDLIESLETTDNLKLESPKLKSDDEQEKNN